MKPLEDIVGEDISSFSSSPASLLALPETTGFARAREFFEDYPTYKFITTIKDLRAALKRGSTMALDLETTSLSPETGKVRTINLCGDTPESRVVVDCWKIRGGFEACAAEFIKRKVTGVVFHAGFEYSWFLAAGAVPRMIDVGNMRRAVQGGGQFSLKLMALWDLEIEMSKEQQLSDWSKPELDKEQLDYAFLDGEITWKLFKHWGAKMDQEHWAACDMFDALVPAVHEMQASGMLLDPAAHAKLTQSWKDEADGLHLELRKLLPASDVANLNSNSQLSDYFSKLLPDAYLRVWPRTEKSGQLQMTRKALETMAGVAAGTPLSAFLMLLRDHQRVRKYWSSFGETLITSASLTGDNRIHAQYRIGAAKTGRFSSASPNVQQIPRDNPDWSVRASFIAPRGRRLVSLDYSGIELRTLALLSEDDALFADCVHGDLHLAVAEGIAGRKLDRNKDKELRQAAKAVSFGIIYGSGAGGLAATMGKTHLEASRIIDMWEGRYPRAFNYRYKIEAEAKDTGFVRTALGGTIWLSKKPSLPKCANYPVQRAALEVMARAIIRHKETLDDLRSIGHELDWGGDNKIMLLLSTIHDALIDEAPTSHANALLKLMKEDMTLGYLDVFPGADTANLVEGGIGTKWSNLS